MESTIKTLSRTFGVKPTDIASHLGITRGAFNDYVNKGKKIPDKHIPKLVELFNIDEKWIRKSELTEEDLYEIKLEHLKKQTKGNKEFESLFKFLEVTPNKVLERTKDLLQTSPDRNLPNKIDKVINIYSNPDMKQQQYLLSRIVYYIHDLYEKDINEWKDAQIDDITVDFHEMLKKHGY